MHSRFSAKVGLLHCKLPGPALGSCPFSPSPSPAPKALTIPPFHRYILSTYYVPD